MGVRGIVIGSHWRFWPVGSVPSAGKTKPVASGQYGSFLAGSLMPQTVENEDEIRDAAVHFTVVRESWGTPQGYNGTN